MNRLIGILTLLVLLAAAFIAGGYYSPLRILPEEGDVVVIDTNTIVVFDTIERHGGVNGDGVSLQSSSPVDYSSFIIDTAAVIKAHYSRSHYSASYEDSSINLELSPVLERGHLDSIGIKYTLLQPSRTQIITQNRYLPQPDWEVYLGGASHIGQDYLGASTQITARYDERWLFEAGYGITNQGGVILLGASYKLFQIK